MSDNQLKMEIEELKNKLLQTTTQISDFCKSMTENSMNPVMNTQNNVNTNTNGA